MRYSLTGGSGLFGGREGLEVYSQVYFLSLLSLLLGPSTAESGAVPSHVNEQYPRAQSQSKSSLFELPLARYLITE